MTQIKYESIKIGKFESDNLDYSAVVIYLSENERHVTVWKYGFKVIDQQMTKSEWNVVRDQKELILNDVQSAEFPEGLLQ